MSYKTVIAGLLLTVAGISLLLVAHARSGRTDNIESLGPSDRVEAELLVLRSDGFTPNEIRRRPGGFLLALQNHSSEEEVSFVLTQESGPSLRQIRFARRQSKLREFIELPPGRYVLAETNHPEWRCLIVIAAN